MTVALVAGYVILMTLFCVLWALSRVSDRMRAQACQEIVSACLMRVEEHSLAADQYPSLHPQRLEHLRHAQTHRRYADWWRARARAWGEEGQQGE